MTEYLSIDDLNQQDDTAPIWVVNRSAETQTHSSEIFLAIQRGNGNPPTQIRIDRTWLPINLTAKAPRYAILDSSQFMDVINKEILGVISAEQAAELNGRPFAVRERERIKQLQDVVKAAGQAKGLSANKNVTVTNSDDDEETKEDRKQVSLTPIGEGDGPEPSAVKASAKKRISISMADEDDTEVKAEDDLPANFRAWVNKLNTLPEEDAKNEIEIKGSFEPEELRYLAAHTTHAKIKRTMEKNIAALED